MDLGFKVTRLYKFEGQGPVKAVCDISIAGQFVVKGFRVVEGKNGLFVGVPRESGKDGRWYNKAFPLTPETRKYLDQVVLSAYENS
ncbi:MAG: SpoVG family protein [Candidatus Omnitrophica bacterium]|nr:SpoVG family protein [Candidatus Omnitrophota bacterium]MCF7892219.1 SpoVG family protein [Candidatus Omnitrophota bacterium]MCF7896156.1 SpoVG family protein [Candidatus Omnitrophota bacterium]